MNISESAISCASQWDLAVWLASGACLIVHSIVSWLLALLLFRSHPATRARYLALWLGMAVSFVPAAVGQLALATVLFNEANQVAGVVCTATVHGNYLLPFLVSATVGVTTARRCSRLSSNPSTRVGGSAASNSAGADSERPA